MLVKLIGIGNNKDYNNDDEKSKSDCEYEGDDDRECKSNKGSDNESDKGSDKGSDNENENSVY